MTKKPMVKGICQLCGQETKCYESTDMNGDGDGGQGTGLVCLACATAQKMERCAHCGEMRFPENLTQFDDSKYQTYGRKYCHGCFDEVADALEEES